MSPAKRQSVSPFEDSRMHDALEKVRKEVDAVAESELIHINIDIPAAVTTVFGALPAMRAMRERMDAEAKSSNIKLLDKLETYALALLKANTLYVTATRPSEPLPELVETATALRDVMYADTLALLQRGLLAPEALRGVKTGPGHRQLVVDLMSLAQVLGGLWDHEAHRPWVRVDEIRRANDLAERLVAALGEREFATGAASEAASVRARVFVLFMRAYDELRKTVTYLRWNEGDADEIAPSLYAGRGSPGRRKNADDADPAAKPDAVAPAPVKPATGPSTPIESRDVAPAAGSTAIGMPASDPFVAA